MTTHVDRTPTVAENVAVLLHRSQVKQQTVAHRLGMTGATMSRRMSGQQPWLLWEVQALAEFFGVTLDELAGDLPSRAQWEARPKGFEPLTFCSVVGGPVLRLIPGGRTGVKSGLTADCLPALVRVVAS